MSCLPLLWLVAEYLARVAQWISLVCPSGAHEITPICCGVCVAESSVFCIINSGLLLAHLYYSFWSLCYRFVDLWLLVASFASGNFCNINYNNIKNSFSRNKVL